MEQSKLRTIRAKGTRQLAYLAGIIDGEGTIYIQHTQRGEYRLKLYVVNTYEPLIRWLQDNFDGLVYSRISKKNPHWKRKWEWMSNAEILPEIIDYLIVKKEQAKLAIEFRKTFHQNRRPNENDIVIRKKCFEEVKKLNNRVWLGATTKRKDT